MQEIHISTQTLKLEQDNLNNLAKYVSSLSERLESVGNMLPFQFSEKERILQTIRRVAADINSQSSNCASLSTSLHQIVSLYENTENKISGAASSKGMAIENSSIDGVDGTTTTFDDDPSNGGYGGNQGDMAKNKTGFQFFAWRWFEDEELFDFVRRYPQYKDLSQNEIAALMEQMNSEGCGYIAMVNAIFVEFEGREDEFEKIFGFPMYDKNGEANYNRLFIDIYATTDDKYFLNESEGEYGLLNQFVVTMTEEEFIARFGCPPTTEAGYLSPEALNAVMAEYEGQDVVTIEGSRNNCYTIENRLNGYLAEKGIAAQTSGCSSMTPSEVKTLLDNGSSVNIGAVNFNLYDENGKVLAKNVGGHEMTITGVTDDGRYIVSSWGKKYYMNPSELNNETDYIILDFE